MKKKILILCVMVLLLGAAAYLKVKAGESHNTTGWIWGGSEEIDDSFINGNESGLGWISFNSSNCDPNNDGQSGPNQPSGCPPVGTPIAEYGVGIQTTTAGELTGYAWSENVGWISFNSDDLLNCPSGNGSCKARRLNDKIEGWARILSIKDAFAAGNSGGWQGWIRLNGHNYGMKIIHSDEPDYEDLDGWIWSDELGWIEISDAKVKIASNLIICPPEASVSIGDIVQLQAWYSSSSPIRCGDTHGATDVTSSATWSSQNRSIATVNSSGQVSGVDEGSTQIEAKYGEVKAVPAKINVTAMICQCVGDPSRFCKGKFFNDTCGVPKCQGTKNCEPKWIETEP